MSVSLARKITFVVLDLGLEILLFSAVIREATTRMDSSTPSVVSTCLSCGVTCNNYKGNCPYNTAPRCLQHVEVNCIKHSYRLLVLRFFYIRSRHFESN